MKPLTIGRVARQAGVGVETVRYYQRRGLVAQPPRRDGAYRVYTQDTVARIRFIRRAGKLGFTLREIEELLSLRVEQSTTCADVRMRAEVKVSTIDDKIQGLQHMKRALASLIASCRGRGPASECPILEALDEEVV